jgi:hypothetical protein
MLCDGLLIKLETYTELKLYRQTTGILLNRKHARWPLLYLIGQAGENLGVVSLGKTSTYQEIDSAGVVHSQQDSTPPSRSNTSFTVPPAPTLKHTLFLRSPFTCFEMTSSYGSHESEGGATELLKMLICTLLCDNTPLRIPYRASIGTKGQRVYPGSTFCVRTTSAMAKNESRCRRSIPAMGGILVRNTSVEGKIWLCRWDVALDGACRLVEHFFRRGLVGERALMAACRPAVLGCRGLVVGRALITCRPALLFR